MSLLLLAGPCAGPAAAQEREAEPAGRRGPTPPFRGLFGPTEQEELRPPAWTLTTALAAGVDDNTRFDAGGIADDSLQFGRTHQGVQTALTVVRWRPHLQITFVLESAVRYFQSLRRIGAQKHGAAARLVWRATPQWTLQLQQSTTYSPSYQLALNTTAADAHALSDITVDYAVLRAKQMTHGWVASATFALNAANELAVEGSARVIDFFGAPGYSGRRIGARYSRRLGPGLALNAGYGVADSALAGQPRTVQYDVDLGLNYGRALQFSPRTTLAFTTGSAIVQTPAGRAVPVLGTVLLQRQLSRRWTAEVEYQRGLRSIERTATPFVASTANGTLSGWLHTRARLRVKTTYAAGTAVGSAGTYHSGSSEARLELGLTRHWAWFVDHFAYRYRFGAVDAPAFVPREIERHGVRTGLALWAPIRRR